MLVQERLPKPSNPWSGLTFPGGHVEPGETVVASVIREVQEETGLTVSNLQNCGYIQWYNPVKQSQYFVFLFKTSTFSGELTGSVEGNVKWMTLGEMLAGKLAPNIDQIPCRLPKRKHSPSLRPFRAGVIDIKYCWRGHTDE